MPCSHRRRTKIRTVFHHGSKAPVSYTHLDVYKRQDHTTADDARRYRDDAEVKAAWEKEPFLRLRKFLTDQGVWDEAQEKAWIEDSGKRVDEEINAYLNTPVQPVEAMFDYLYAELPSELITQRTEAMAREHRA